MSRDYLAALIRKLAADGASRDAIARALDSELVAATSGGKADSVRCQRIRRIQFYLRTRLVPRNTTSADMAILRALQNLR